LHFDGKVCGLVSAKQVAAIPGVSSHCTSARPAKGPGSTIYAGTWNGTSPTAPALQVTVALYTDKGALQLATRNLAQGLPGSPPRKLTGIGSAAYEATGASAIGIHFAVHDDVVYVILTTTGKPPRASLEQLAKAIAARL
jgi:hypothetical protein